MTNTIKSTAAVASLAALIALGYVAFRTEAPIPQPIRVDAIAPATAPISIPYEMESVQPDVQPFTPEEHVTVTQTHVASAATGWVLIPAMQLTAHQQMDSQRIMAAAGAIITTAPILDERQRECVAIPIVANPKVKRMNLQLLPNLREVVRKRWSDATWRESIRVGPCPPGSPNATCFPINLWRGRGSTVTFWTTLYVPTGPGLPSGTPQFPLDAEFFRGGDVLLIEASRDGALLIAYDPETGLIAEPRVSVIEPLSSDPTSPFGAWTKISEVRP